MKTKETARVFKNKKGKSNMKRCLNIFAICLNWLNYLMKRQSLLDWI